MANESFFKKVPLPVILVVIAALVVSAVVSFYLGRLDGQTVVPAAPQPPVATGPGAAPPAANGLVRLPLQRFENWSLACVQNAAKVTRCNLVLQAVNKANKKPVLNLAITRNAKGRALMIVVTPPGALLAAGVRLTPGSGKEIVAQFVKCGRGACEAVAMFDDAVADEFTAASVTTVVFVAGNGKPLSLKIPNGGFGAAYPAWLAAMPAPEAAPSAAPAPRAPAPAARAPVVRAPEPVTTPAPSPAP
jgi:invasion protein IalB